MIVFKIDDYGLKIDVFAPKVGKNNFFRLQNKNLTISSRHVVAGVKTYLLAQDPTLYLLNPGTRSFFGAGKVHFRGNVFLTPNKTFHIFRNPFSSAVWCAESNPTSFKTLLWNIKKRQSNSWEEPRIQVPLVISVRTKEGNFEILRVPPCAARLSLSTVELSFRSEMMLEFCITRTLPSRKIE